MTRPAIVLIGLAYLLQATWVLEGGADLFFPRYQTVNAGESSCCSGACGCSAQKRALESCCCFPKKASTPKSSPGQPSSTKVRLSTVEESRCKGAPAAIADVTSQPAAPGPTQGPRPPFLTMRFEWPSRTPALP